jgi:hypothetical protein
MPVSERKQWRRLGGSALLACVAIAIAATVWFVGWMMSVDEEWTGWGDVLLNPYIMGPTFVAALGCVGGAVLLYRRP